MRRSHLIAGLVGLVAGFGLSEVLKLGAQSDSADEGQAAHEARRQPQLKSSLAPTGGAASAGESEDKDSNTPGSAAGPPGEEMLAGPVATPAEFDEFVARHGHSREALIAAFQLEIGGDRHLLEAARRYPEDPHVQYLVLAGNLLPEQRAEWLRRFKESQPDNALASLFLGEQLFEDGKAGEAVEQLRLAATQDSLEDFGTEGRLARESAMLEFGYTPYQAKLKATFGAAVGFFGDFNRAQQSLQELAGAEADTERKTELAIIGAGLGNQFTQGAANGLLINRVVGIGTEGTFLRMLDPQLESPHLASTPAAMIDQLKAERQEIFELTGLADQMMRDFSEAELSHYLDRVVAQGELEAMRWARDRVGGR